MELQHWEGDAVSAWRDRWRLPRLHVHDRVGSTNDEARALAEAGAPEGTVVMAIAQTAGRGRRGRRWTAPPGTGLLLSMVLRPRATGAETVLSLRLGMAAARAVESVTRVPVGIKWPNDLWLERRKVGGVLVEAAFQGGSAAFAIAGIGLNLRDPEGGWPDHAGDPVSLETARGAPIDTPALAGHVVTEWLAVAGQDSAALDRAELAEFRRRDVLEGHPVTLDGEPAGTARGISGGGALIVSSAGQRREVLTGTPRISDEPQEHSP